MKLSDFIIHPEAEKNKVLLHQGVLIGKRKLTESFVFLFQLHHFYVEMFCNMENKQVTQYRAFADTMLLQPYLEGIAIDQLLQ